MTESPSSCFIAHVSGKVQGVFFRAHTAQIARKLRVTGHARNLDDGRVEVLAVGSSDALDRMISYLRTGSPASHVENVEVSEQALPDDPPDTFTTG